MALGAGKYDELCTYVVERSGAVGAIVMVLGGEKGSGFSVQAPFEVLARLPGVLRTIAEGIENDSASGDFKRN
jgi:hypothetical protein